jgi:1-acyl-sn-glycerol-3-phosphate acyltransferase
MAQTMTTFDKNKQPLDEQGLARHIECALATQAPGGLELAARYRMIQLLFKPVVVGMDNIPQQPCLFVGNHSLFALDAMVLTPILQQRLGRFLRPLADRIFWEAAPVGSLATRQGAVLGHPEVCSALMENGEDLLVFPGGAHESVKPASEFYTLQWKQRYGFIRLAAQHGYTIVPFGMVGPDQFYSHYKEGKELAESPLGVLARRQAKLLQRLGLLSETNRDDLVPPIPVGALGTLFPKLQRCYIGFGEAMDLSAHQGKSLSATRMRALRDRVALTIEQQLSELLLAQKQDEDQQSVLRRILSR